MMRRRSRTAQAGSWSAWRRSTRAHRIARRASKWVLELADALQQGDRGVYVSFMGEESAERVRAAYPGSTWTRLAAIKARYDPDNVFRLNQNVPPR
jgi:FAD/FMN-containing dehydrogenase